MNIVKLQRQLESVPEQALIGYVQNPNGQVPSYLALTELNRRKTLRAEYQKQSAPEQSVAESMVAEAQPQGVAGLPVNEQMFTAPETGIMAPVATAAAGGEVHGHAQEVQRFAQNYARGGEVQHFANRGLVEGLTSNKLAPLGVPQPQWDAMSDYEKSNYILSKRKTALPASQIQDDSLNSILPGRKKLQTQQAGISELPAAVERKPIITNNEKGKGYIPPDEKPKDPSANPAVSVGTPAVTGIGRVSYETPTDYSAEYDANLRPELSAQEAMAKYQGLMGTDVGRQKLNERLAAMEAKAVKEEEQAPWMALANAGLGIAAGKSQFALQNIAEGAQVGLRDYAAARERLAAKEEKRFSIQSQLAQAERAERAAAATYGLQSEEAARAGREANRLAKLGYKANLASDKAKGEFEAKKTNLEADIAERKLEEETRWHDKQYQADMARTGVMGANAQFTKEQAQATNLLKQIMAPKIAALKSSGMAEEDAYDQVYPGALAQLPPNMLAALGYNKDTLPKTTPNVTATTPEAKSKLRSILGM
jgi:hypothetical protein